MQELGDGYGAKSGYDAREQLADGVVEVDQPLADEREATPPLNAFAVAGDPKWSRTVDGAVTAHVGDARAQKTDTCYRAG